MVPIMDEAHEALVQLCGIDGAIRISAPVAGYAVTLRWDPRAFNSCVLWYSHGGTQDYPFSGRNFCLGVEPVTSALDLGLVASRFGNPIALRGTATTVTIDPSSAWEVHYSIHVDVGEART